VLDVATGNGNSARAAVGPIAIRADYLETVIIRA
jgi:hypothetical protein